MIEKYRIASRMMAISSLAFLLVQCGRNSHVTNATGNTAIVNLADLAQLKRGFNDDQGRVRLVALLSPV